MGLNKRLIDQAGGGSGPNSPIDIATWTGNATDNRQITVTNNPDFVIVKRRSFLSSWLWTYDDSSTIYYLSSNNNFPGSSYSGGVKAFNDGSFTLGPGGLANDNGQTCVGYSFQGGGAYVSNSNGSITSSTNTNVGGGFSIVKHTAPSSEQNYTIGHGLSQKPDMVILKGLDSASAWFVWHKDLSVESYYLYLNGTFSESDLTQDTRIWGQQSFTDTVISTRSNYTTSLNQDYISYCFHSVDGYQKIGSYTSSYPSTTSVNVGFQPRFVMIKSYNQARNWVIHDSARTDDKQLYPNLINAEADTGTQLQFTSTGFNVSGGSNDLDGGSSYSYIYLAIA
jgi:hypothetical protein